MLLVIGGDDQYSDEDEKERSVISRWARRKVASQFSEECLDGRRSFIFSWNKQHREIHEEALRHYLDSSKKGWKFEYQPKPKPVPLPKRADPPPPKEPLVCCCFFVILSEKYGFWNLTIYPRHPPSPPPHPRKQTNQTSALKLPVCVILY